MGKKKVKKKNKKSFLLDTSIFIEKCKYPSIQEFLEKKRSGGYNLVSAFFVLYEYKVGFIMGLIDFYFMVKAYDEIDKALVKWSEKWGRASKNALIYMAMILRIKKSINNSDVITSYSIHYTKLYDYLPLLYQPSHRLPAKSKQRPRQPGGIRMLSPRGKWINF